MYSESADLYDLVYLNQGKDYAAEAAQIRELVQRYKKSEGNLLLDVACGTGLHAGYLREFFQVEGLDIAEDMIEAARKKYPDIPFHTGDMRGFDLGREFDVVTCLFSSIGYVADTDQLNSAIASMNRHLKPGGVLLVEPWFGPDTWKPGTIHTIFVDKPELKIVRMNLSEQKGRLSFFTLHFRISFFGCGRRPPSAGVSASSPWSSPRCASSPPRPDATTAAPTRSRPAAWRS